MSYEDSQSLESATINITCAEAIRQYLEFVDARVAIGSLRRTTGILHHRAFRYLTDPCILLTSVSAITSAHIESWYIDVVLSKAMSIAAASRRLDYMNAMFEFSIRRRWRTGNPAKEAIKALGRPTRRPIETFSVEEVGRLLNTVDRRAYRSQQRPYERTRLAVHLAAFCGLRWGEIFALKADVINLQHRNIQILRSLDAFGTTQPCKTKSSQRVVSIPEHIATMLEQYMRDWQVVDSKEFVFITSSGGPPTASTFRNAAWLPLLARAGIDRRADGPLHFHALRHFAVSWMIDNGWPVTEVSAIVGHASVKTTLTIYAHAVRSRPQSNEAMQMLARRLIENAEPAPLPPLKLIDIT